MGSKKGRKTRPQANKTREEKTTRSRSPKRTTRAHVAHTASDDDDDEDGDDGGAADTERARRYQRRQERNGGAAAMDLDSSNGNDAGDEEDALGEDMSRSESDGDDTGVAGSEDETEEWPEPEEDPYPPLPDDPKLAVVELRRRIAQTGGQEPLVRVTMEYADDQTQVMALERQDGVPPEWRLEEQLLAEDATERLHICMEVYAREAGYKMSVGKCYVRWGVGARPVPRRTGPVTDEELATLDLKFHCAGCKRKEASMASKLGHERRCPYVTQVRHWHNPAAIGVDNERKGEWEVERVLQLRGPPEARYVQLLWAPGELDLEVEQYEFTDLEDANGQPISGDGSWAYGWQPMANCLNLRRTLIADWFRDNRDINPNACIERRGEWRCIHCNYISQNKRDTDDHVAGCEWKPKPRPRNSLVGRMLARQDVEKLQQQFPPVTITDPDSGEAVTLQAKHDTTSLGHIFSADATSDKDMRVRMAKADVEFYRAMPLWRCKVLSRRSKLRMYRRYLMILVYAGASCWILDAAARRALNHWNGAKMAAITGNTHKAENARRRVEICLILRYWRRRLLGEILRAHPDDIRRSEVVQHAELVRKGRIPKAGSLVMDVADYDSVDELKRRAGYVPPGALETLTVARSAELERNHVKWVADDQALRPDELSDSDEDEDAPCGCAARPRRQRCGEDHQI